MPATARSNAWRGEGDGACVKKGERGSREKFAAIDRHVRALGCDCAILACTELSVYRAYHDLPDFYMDAMEVLVERSITACGKKLRNV